MEGENVAGDGGEALQSGGIDHTHCRGSRLAGHGIVMVECGFGSGYEIRSIGHEVSQDFAVR